VSSASRLPLLATRLRPNDDVFYHDVPPELAAEARRREGEESSKALGEPWPLQAWPDVPTRYLLCRDDRMFPAAWARRHARERFGIEADEIDGGHYITLSRPLEQRCQHIASFLGTAPIG
jgi:pimeloyl-ACP methyl ester carboxylesterase